MTKDSLSLFPAGPCSRALPAWLSLPSPLKMSDESHSQGIYIGKGSPFSNPFIGNMGDCPVNHFRSWIKGQPELLRLVRQKMPGSSLRQAPFSEHGQIYREIAEGHWDHQIPDEPVFVFGSNLAGRHGRGAAADARDQYGAEYGCGEGFTGHAYALPTKDERIESLSLEKVLGNIDRFVDFANCNPGVMFRLSAVGTGLASQPDDKVRDHVLKNVPANVLLPGRWDAARDSSVVRVIVAGTRDFKDYGLMCRKLDVILSRLENVEIVSGGARGADLLGERYAAERSLPIRRMPALWDAFRFKAGAVRNRRMAWYATHLVAFWDGKSTGTKSMIEMAADSRLQARTVLY